LSYEKNSALFNKTENLDTWRSRGFQEWPARQATLAQARELAADAQEIAATTRENLTDQTGLGSV